MFPFGISGKTLAVLYRQLATMDEAGLSITRSFDTLIRQHRGRLKRVLTAMRDSVVGGSTLTEAFAKHPDIFSQMHVSIIGAGEASGSLSRSLETLADLMERRTAVTRRLFSGLVYPLLLLHVAAVVPRAAKYFFPDVGKVLTIDPLPGLIGFYCVVAAGLLVCKMLRGLDVLILVLERILLFVPVLGRIWHKVVLARFALFMGSLYRAGLPMTEAIDTAGKACGSRAIGRAASNIVSEIEGGTPLGEAFESNRLFPPLFVAMVTTGEETGDTDKTMAKMAEYNQAEAETAIDALLKIAPIFIFLAIAVYLGLAVITGFTRIYSFLP